MRRPHRKCKDMRSTVKFQKRIKIFSMSFSGAEGKRKREGEGFGIKYVLIRKVVCVLEDFLLLPNVFNYFHLSG